MADLQIQNPSITSGAFASMLAFSSDNNTITAISGHPIAGVGGGGTPVEGYWRPSVNADGDISWAWSLESTSTVPSTANIKGPQGIQGETGPQGPSGTNGKDGKDGTNGTNGKDATPITATTTTAVGGTQVTISYTSGGDPLAQFTVLSGTKGADGQDGQKGTDGIDGISPTFTTSVTSDAQHSQGGTHVVISGAAGENAFNVWNGVGATVNLIEGNGVQITHEAGTTDYTIGVSADYLQSVSVAADGSLAGSGTTNNPLVLKISAENAIKAVSAKSNVDITSAGVTTVTNTSGTTINKFAQYGEVDYHPTPKMFLCATADSQADIVSVLGAASGMGAVVFVVQSI